MEIRVQKLSEETVIEAVDEGVVGRVVMTLENDLGTTYANVEQTVAGHEEVLLAAAEKEARQCKCTYLSFIHPPELNALLLSLNWSPSRLYKTIYRFHVPSFAPRWFTRDYPPLPPGMEIFSWDKLQEEEQKRLRYLEEQDAIAEFISPFGKEEALIEPINSLGVRCDGEVIGWMITHRIAPDTIRYSEFYIDKKWQYTGMAPKLLIQSIRQQQNSTVPFARVDINHLLVNPHWEQFLKKRLAPYAEETRLLRQSWKRFAF